MEGKTITALLDEDHPELAAGIELTISKDEMVFKGKVIKISDRNVQILVGEDSFSTRDIKDQFSISLIPEIVAADHLQLTQLGAELKFSAKVQSLLDRNLPIFERNLLVMNHTKGAELLQKGQYDAARQHFNDAVDIARKFNHQQGEAACSSCLGDVHLALSQYPRALELYSRSREIQMKNGNIFGEAAACGNLGIVYAHLGDNSNAVAMLERTLTIKRELGDLEGEGIAYSNLGGIHRQFGNYSLATEMHEKSIEIAKHLGDISQQGKYYSNLGNVYFETRSYNKALEMYEAALDIARRLGSIMSQSYCHNNLGGINLSLGRFQDAANQFQEALRILEQIGDSSGQVGALNNLSIVYSSLGQYDTAIEMITRSLHMATKVGDADGESKAYSGLGHLHAVLGQYDSAIFMYKRSIRIDSRTGHRPGAGKSYTNLANLFRLIQDDDRAITAVEQGLIVAKLTGDATHEAASLMVLGSLHMSAGRHERAIELMEEARSIAVRQGEIPEEGLACCNLGVVHRVLGRLEQSCELLERACAIATSTGDAAARFKARFNFGTTLTKAGRLEEAILHLVQALAACEELQASLRGRDAERVSIFEDQRQCYLALQEALLSVGRPGEALAVAERGKARALHRLLLGTEAGEVGMGFCGDALSWEDVRSMARQEGAAVVEYSLLDDGSVVCWLLSDSGDLLVASRTRPDGKPWSREGSAVDTADSVAGLVERARSSSSSPALAADEGVRGAALRSWLVKAGDCGGCCVDPSATTGANSGTDEDDEDSLAVLARGEPWLREEARAMLGEKRRVRAWVDSLAAVAKPPANAASDALCGPQSRNLDSLGEDPPSTSVDQGASAVPWSAKALEEALAALRLRLLQWDDVRALSESALERDFGVIVPGLRAWLLEQAAAALDNAALMSRLYDVLIAPVAGRLAAGSALVVVPDVELFAAPWAALACPAGHPLVERHSIRLVPSLLVSCTAASAAREAVAPADVGSGGQCKVQNACAIAATAAAVPPTSGCSVAPRRAAVVGNPWPLCAALPVGFGPLAHAEAEAAAAAAALRRRGLQVDALMGGRATREAVEGSIGGASWVHLACHGWLDRLSLVLSPRPDSDDDGLLSATDVVKLGARGGRLAAGSTVLLSGCNTGRGPVRGEGVAGLARAFLGAGAGAVVVSLWPVPDAGTRRMIDAVYYALAGGRRVPEALRFAMCAARRGGAAAPALWARFVVVGASTELPAGAGGSGGALVWGVDELAAALRRCGAAAAAAEAEACGVDGKTWVMMTAEERAAELGQSADQVAAMAGEEAAADSVGDAELERSFLASVGGSWR